MVGLQQEGLDLIWRAVVLAVVLCGPFPAWAVLTQVPDEEIAVDIIVNYGSAYKDGTWVPVDVLVDNKDFDVSGWVEVKTFSGPSGDEEQSPRYRVRAESPRNSRKRFRLYCRLDRTTRVEAMLYRGRRSALDLPAWFQVEPIDSDALLGLILDDEPVDFGFLYNLAPGAGSGRRFHREGLNTDLLSSLADHGECYEPFDLIVMGDIDPNRVGLRHREVLRDYVRAGGVLVVCTGANGTQYRGTWVEGLLGVEMGQQEVWNELDLAKAAFDDEEQEGARDGWECVVTQLVPAAPEVKVRGKDRVVATLRPIGGGCVAGIAVDASSRALQGCVGYRNLWRDLFLLRSRPGQLNLAAAAEACSWQWPQIIGMSIASRSSVLIYLCLYVGIGVIANWFVCSIFRRRELAWVLLVVFSAGFTAYAMIFGTEGRAKAGELEQFEVLRIPKDGGRARLHSILGVVSARTQRYSMDLAGDGALVENLPSGVLPWASGGRGAGLWARPFNFVQDEPERIEDFVVGASELRLIRVDTALPSPGRVEGHLVLDEKGLNGTLFNKTGYAIREPFVVLDGHIYGMKSRGDSWEIALPRGRLDRDALRPPAPRPYGYYGPGAPSEGNLDSFRRDFLFTLLSDQASRDSVDGGLGPLVCGWTTGACIGGVAMDEQVKNGTAQGLLLVADIEVVREAGIALGPYPLKVEVSDATRGGWQANGNVAIMVPSWLARREPEEIIVEITRTVSEDAPPYFNLLRDGMKLEVTDVIQETSETRDGRLTRRTKYRIADWRSYFDSGAHRIYGETPHPAGRSRGEEALEISAWAVMKSEDGEQSKWR